MITDRFGLPLTTASHAARDAYVEGCDLVFAIMPGAQAAFARAIAEDPGFALAHIGAAMAAVLAGDNAGIAPALAAAKAQVDRASPREASHVDFFSLLLSGKSAAAQVAARLHLGEWPRDAMVMNQYGPILGLISFSGRPGLKREQELVMDAFAPHFGGDWWYDAHHAMALSEVGRRDEAQGLAERSFAANPRNAWSVHSLGHIAYENGQAESVRPALVAWLRDAPVACAVYGHLAWHLAIADLTAGRFEDAAQRFAEAVAPGKHKGLPRSQIYDAAQFLWRWEMAGQARDSASWERLDALAAALMPTPGVHFVDWHVVLANAVAGNTEALERRIGQMEALSRAGRYPEGPIVTDTALGLAAFARGEYGAAVDRLTPVLGEIERLGGSRAQLDLIEFTVLRACVEAGRHDELLHHLGARRQGPTQLPVVGVMSNQ